ncbi:glycosyltransferase [Bifidobacterium scaligerum]|uniref:Glycosyltransferase family 1 protein n=1 Tax=Bifidobacterium scaligerum TaxID=2052656 RepID=A0A2M9HS84_9BIFI|nr:glycosyltransferase [Bifidobacterium scaligerum]PJM79662.1 glycosyltransferase family 1 protein [Bifidobacterium scaligerum]
MMNTTKRHDGTAAVDRGDARLRVLIVQEAMGGCGRHVADLIAGLDHSRFDVTLLYGTGRVDAYFRSRIAQLQQCANLIGCDDLCREIDPVRDLRAFIETVRVIRRVRPDIVHCHSTKGGVIGRAAAWLCRVPAVFYTPHAYAFQSPQVKSWKRHLYVAVELILARVATTRTLNVSAGERREALKHRLGRPDRFHVVINGLADVTLPHKAVIRERLGLPQHVPIVGVVARLVDQKCPMTAVRIARRLIAHDAHVHVAFVGSGPLESEVRAFCAENGIEHNVHFLGERDDADLIVGAFDVSLLCSLYEGLPYSLIESIRAGVPIAASAVTGNEDVVREGVNGWTFPVEDVDAGAAAVERLLVDPPQADDVRKDFSTRFRIENMLTDITEQYELVQDKAVRHESMRYGSASSSFTTVATWNKTRFATETGEQ